ARGSVDVVSAYTSDGRIKALDLVVLEDPKRAFPPYDAVLLVSPRAAQRPRCVETLKPLVGAIPVDLMREANRRVDVDRQTVRRAAQGLLRDVEQGRAARSGAQAGLKPRAAGGGPWIPS